MRPIQPDVRVVLASLGLALVTGCSTTVASGWLTGSPDAWPRAQKLSVRGPMSRDGKLLVGGEVATEIDSDGDFRVRRGAVLAGVRLRDPELGRDPVALELAGALGVGRGNFDPDREDFGVVAWRLLRRRGAARRLPVLEHRVVPGPSDARAARRSRRTRLDPDAGAAPPGDHVVRAVPGAGPLTLAAS